MMIFLSGLVLTLTGSQTLRGIDERFILLARYKILNVNITIIIYIVMIIFFEIVLKGTVYGRNVYAVGGNQTASKFFGINIDLTKILAFSITGFLSGLAGIMFSSKLNMASILIGTGSPILVITAVLLGGVSLSGGQGSIFQAFQGMLLIGIINKTQSLLRISQYVKDVISGIILITILVVDSINIRKYKYL
jgi:ribose/xylose/arabinose/galactoside ABC-type transport system permease subunit